MGRRQPGETVSGVELRARVKALGLTYGAAAERLGLSLAGLNKQMRGLAAVSRQTLLLLEGLEREHERALRGRRG